MTAVLDLFDRLSLTRKLTAIGVVTSAVSLVVAGAILMAYDVSNSREDWCAIRERSPKASRATARPPSPSSDTDAAG